METKTNERYKQEISDESLKGRNRRKKKRPRKQAMISAKMENKGKRKNMGEKERAGSERKGRRERKRWNASITRQHEYPQMTKRDQMQARRPESRYTPWYEQKPIVCKQICWTILILIKYKTEIQNQISAGHWKKWRRHFLSFFRLLWQPLGFQKIFQLWGLLSSSLGSVSSTLASASNRFFSIAAALAAAFSSFPFQKHLRESDEVPCWPESANLERWQRTKKEIWRNCEETSNNNGKIKSENTKTERETNRDSMEQSSGTQVKRIRFFTLTEERVSKATKSSRHSIFPDFSCFRHFRIAAGLTFLAFPGHLLFSDEPFSSFFQNRYFFWISVFLPVPSLYRILFVSAFVVSTHLLFNEFLDRDFFLIIIVLEENGKWRQRRKHPNKPKKQQTAQQQRHSERTDERKKWNREHNWGEKQIKWYEWKERVGNSGRDLKMKTAGNHKQAQLQPSSSPSNGPSSPLTASVVFCWMTYPGGNRCRYLHCDPFGHCQKKPYWRLAIASIKCLQT